jgi:hypothetical protein
MKGYALFFKQFVQFLNTADENLAQQLISPNAQFYLSNRTEVFEGPIGYLKIIEEIQNHCHHIHWEIADITIGKDKYCIKFSVVFIIKNVSVNDISKQMYVTNTYYLANNQIIEGYDNTLDILHQKDISSN